MKRIMVELLAVIMLILGLNPCAVAEDIILDANDYSTGDIITFGSYEQDGDFSNGNEPLQWIVLAKEGERVLLITRDSIDRGPYQIGLESDHKEPKWSMSSIRGWLNTDFIETAFSEVEQKAILLTDLDNSEFDEENTRDHVFLLSIEEVQRYMPSDAAQSAHPTEYAEKKSGKLSTSSDWMLRTHTTYKSGSQRVYFARESGGVSYGYIDGTSYYCVRPAMWVDFSNMGQEDITGSVEPSEYSVGDRVFIGHFEQDGDEENGAEPIQWEILEREGDYAILESTYVLTCRPLNYAYESIAWYDSTLRYWLNTDFYNSAFTKEERCAISSMVWSEGYPDRVSLRPQDEVEAEYREKMRYDDATAVVAELQKSPTRAVRQQWGGGTLYTDWWVISGDEAYNATYISERGLFNSGSAENLHGVCPRIKVDLRSEAVYKDEAIEEAQQNYGIPDAVNLGDYVKMGKYTTLYSSESEPLSWKVIAVHSNKVLLWSNSEVGESVYTNDRNVYTWSNSDLRKWLNETFYSDAFTAEEKEMILKSETGYSVTKTGVCESDKTEDYVFCLSVEELEECGIEKSVGNDRIWLRNADKNAYASLWNDGVYWYIVPNEYSLLVKPAMWVDKALLEKMVLEKKQQKEAEKQAEIEEDAKPDSLNSLYEIMYEIAEMRYTRPGAMARADYDGDGYYEAFALLCDRYDWEQMEVWYVDPDGAIKLSEAEEILTCEVIDDAAQVYARMGMSDGRVSCWTIIDGEPVSISEEEVLQLAGN